MASNVISGQTYTTPVLGDPVGMRPADKRHYGGLIGEHKLTDGHVVFVTWLPLDQQRVNIKVWDSTGEEWGIQDVWRFHAGPKTEKLFVEIES